MIRELLRQGLPISEVARWTSRDRKTIHKLRDARSDPAPQKRCQRGSKLDPHKPYLRQRAEARVLNAVNLMHKIRWQSYTEGITLVCESVHPLRPAVPLVTERFETLLGANSSMRTMCPSWVWRPTSSGTAQSCYTRG